MKRLLFILLFVVGPSALHAQQKKAEPFLQVSVGPAETGSGNALLVIQQLYDPKVQKPVHFKSIPDQRVLVSGESSGERPSGELAFYFAIFSVELNNAPEAKFLRSSFTNLPASYMADKPGEDAVLFRVHKMEVAKSGR